MAGCRSGLFADTGSSLMQGLATSTCMMLSFGPCVLVPQPTFSRVNNPPMALTYCTPPYGCGDGGSSESEGTNYNDLLFLSGAEGTEPLPLAVRYLRPDRKRRQQEGLQVRQARAEPIQQLLAQGMTQLALAHQLHLNRKTVALSARAPAISAVSQPARAGILAPFTRSLAARWQAGERNGVGLYRAIVAQGYPGSRMTVERFLLGLRDLERQGQLPAALCAPMELTPHRAVGLLLKHAEERTFEETQALLRLDQLHPDVAQARRLMQQFQQMLRERRGEELKAWLETAMHSGMPEWRAFVRKLRQDQAAVQAGLTLKWNNGPVEGHINRLNFLKRSMYGRANFDLLRFRVLHHQT